MCSLKMYLTRQGAKVPMNNKRIDEVIKYLEVFVLIKVPKLVRIVAYENFSTKC